MKPATVDRIRVASLWLALTALLALSYLTWFVAPDWTASPDVTAPLTRKLVFFHPPTAWTAFVAYIVVFGLSIAYLGERKLRYDRAAHAAAGAGFVMNTIALATGTVWGLQEWSKPGQNGLATIYTDPKVLVVVVLWLTFAAYLMLRRLVDSSERRARLAAVFGILGFVAVPASFLTSRVLSTDLHPDIAGPGSNPDAVVAGTVGGILTLGFVAFTLLFIHLFLARLRLAHLEDRLEALEDDA